MTPVNKPSPRKSDSSLRYFRADKPTVATARPQHTPHVPPPPPFLDIGMTSADNVQCVSKPADIPVFTLNPNSKLYRMLIGTPGLVPTRSMTPSTDAGRSRRLHRAEKPLPPRPRDDGTLTSAKSSQAGTSESTGRSARAPDSSTSQVASSGVGAMAPWNASAPPQLQPRVQARKLSDAIGADEQEKRLRASSVPPVEEVHDHLPPVRPAIMTGFPRPVARVNATYSAIPVSPPPTYDESETDLSATRGIPSIPLGTSVMPTPVSAHHRRHGGDTRISPVNGLLSYAPGLLALATPAEPPDRVFASISPGTDADQIDTRQPAAPGSTSSESRYAPYLLLGGDIIPSARTDSLITTDMFDDQATPAVPHDRRRTLPSIYLGQPGSQSEEKLSPWSARGIEEYAPVLSPACDNAGRAGGRLPCLALTEAVSLLCPPTLTGANR